MTAKVQNFNAHFASLADVEAFEKTPIEELVPYNTLYEAFCATAMALPDKPAIIAAPPGDPMADGISISFAQLLGRVNQTANMFKAAGLAEGETVTYLLPLCPQAIFTMLGAEAVGIVNAVNPMLEPEHILGIAKAANATILVATGAAFSPELWEKAKFVMEGLPNLKAVFVLGGGAECDGKFIRPLDASIAEQPTEIVGGAADRGIDEVIGYYHTGGTTGVPKLAPHTNRMQLSQIAATGFGMNFTVDDVLLAGLPMFHISGSIVVGIVPLFNGGTIVMPSPMGFRDPLVIGNYWRLVEKYGVTILGGVPTMLSALLNIPVGDADISSLRAGFTGGSAAPVEVLKAISDQSGVDMLEGYGMTEMTSFTTMQPPHGEPRFGSVGMRLPFVDIKAVILDADNNVTRDADVDEIGVIVMRGVGTMPGYVQAEYNQGSFTNEGWLNSGDLGRIDADGFVWLTGRAKDLIIRSGHNIDPSIIEEALHEHPSVELAAAVGQPDTYAGEMPVAFVQLKPDMAATPEELQEFARERIPERAANPVELHIIPEMPLTGVGKIFKPALRQEAVMNVFSAELAALCETGVDIAVFVDNHPVHGTLATISARGGEEATVRAVITEKLGPYIIRHEIAWSE